MSDPPPPRGPLRAALDEWVFAKKVPAGVGFLRALGTALLLVLLVQAATGMLLALCYVPSPDHAYDSIRYIDEDLAGGVGRLLRGLHHWGSSAVMVLAFFHLARVYFTGAYKRPRRLLWVVGLGIFGLLLGFGFTGYLLPWDMKAFWATEVGMNIVATLPKIGPQAADVLRGGPEIGAPTLTRMFAMHVLFLPALLAPLVGLHLWLVHKLGITPPGARVGEPEVKSEPFFPGHVFKELLVAGYVLGVIALRAVVQGAPLEAEADRDAGGYEPRPEWYFLGLFQLLKYCEGERMILGTVVIPGGLALLLVLLPWLDVGRERAPRRRPITVTAGLLVLAALGTLTVLGALDGGSRAPPKPRVRVGDGSYVPPPSPPIALPAAPGVADSPLARRVAEGRPLAEKYGCLECHTLEGNGDTSGMGAPPLETAAQGHDAAWVDRLLVDPTSVTPDSDMPSAADLGVTSEDRKKLVEWLVGMAAGG